MFSVKERIWSCPKIGLVFALGFWEVTCVIFDRIIIDQGTVWPEGGTAIPDSLRMGTSHTRRWPCNVGWSFGPQSSTRPGSRDQTCGWLINHGYLMKHQWQLWNVGLGELTWLTILVYQHVSMSGGNTSWVHGERRMEALPWNPLRFCPGHLFLGWF